MKYSKIIAALALLVFSFMQMGSGLAQADGSGLFKVVQDELDKDKVTEESLNKLQEFVQQNPRSSNGRLYLGLMLERMGLRKQAFDQLKLAVEYGPENPEALVGLCKKLIKDKHINAAKILVNNGIAKFPNNPDILVMVGDFFIKQKQPVEARILLERAFHIDKTIFGLPSSLAQVYLNRDLTKAVKFATMDLEVRPHYLRARKIRGIAYTGLKLYDRAIKDLQPVFVHDPGETMVARALSQSYYWLGDYDRAIKPAVFLLAFSSKPDVDNLINTNWLVKVLKKIPRDQAIKLVKIHSSRIDKKFNKPGFHYCLGLAYDKLKYREAAMENYRIAIRKKTDFVLAYYRLGVDLELYKKDYSQALDCFTRAHNLRPWDNEINLAYLRLQDRIYNKNRDVSLDIKKWLSGF